MVKKFSMLTYILVISIFSSLVCMDKELPSGVTITTYNIKDLESHFDYLQKKLLPVCVEAFTCEIRQYCLDDKLQIKPEFYEQCKKRFQSPEDAKTFNEMIAIVQCEDKSKRLELAEKSDKTWFFRWYNRLGKRDVYVFIAENEKGRVLGFAAYSIGGSTFLPNTAYNELLVVDPEFKVSGIGMRLLLQISRLNPNPVDCIILDSSPWNTDEHLLYKKLGFEVINCGMQDHIRFRLNIRRPFAL